MVHPAIEAYDRLIAQDPYSPDAPIIARDSRDEYSLGALQGVVARWRRESGFKASKRVRILIDRGYSHIKLLNALVAQAERQPKKDCVVNYTIVPPVGIERELLESIFRTKRPR